MVKITRFRKLKKGEHRYVDISGKVRIRKVENYKKWKENRTYNRKIRSWQYKKEVRPKIEKRYEKAIEKRKQTLQAKKEKEEKEVEEVKPPEVPEKPKKMWRLSVALNYAIHHEYYSYKIQTWGLDEKELLNKIEEYKDRIVKEVEKIVGYNKVDWWFPEEPNVSIQEVEYNERLIYTEEEGNEKKDKETGKRAIRKAIERRRHHKPLDEL